MTARIAPAEPPFAAGIQAALDGLMRGKPPLLLFTTLARDPRLFHKFFAGGLLDRGNLTLRQRELVITRTTALCSSEYEWGVHIALFAAHAGFDEAQVVSLASGRPGDSCWSVEDRLLLELCDMLHGECTIHDALWASLKSAFSDEAMLELLLLAGFYRTVSYLTNALRLPAEPGAARFPVPAAQ
ncbi:carboxymuconolactone decarboxylase family protein [Variovorax sp. GT1P44]|uniref:carboxymuconolactone decarboxylase family protein n=1 Tax=Variovorax sp. GT1P44 TaxID=3443742 RepID=UPI003F488E88